MYRQPHSGFTLVELLVTVAIAAILLGVGVPSFIEMIRDSRLGVQYQSLTSALYLARSEAVKRSEIVTVCARKGNASECGSDWSDGLIVFTDAGGLPGDDTPTIDAADTILLIGSALEGDNEIHAYGIKSGTTSKKTANYVRYRPSGSSEWSVGSVRLCDSEGRERHSRVLNIALTGDIRPGRKDAEGKPLDAFNKAIVCS